MYSTTQAAPASVRPAGEPKPARCVSEASLMGAMVKEFLWPEATMKTRMRSMACRE